MRRRGRLRHQAGRQAGRQAGTLALTTQRPGKRFYCEKQDIETDSRSCAFAKNLARAAEWPEGLDWLQECLKCGGGEGVIIDNAPETIISPEKLSAGEIRPKKWLPKWLKDATPAVRRAYEREGYL